MGRQHFRLSRLQVGEQGTEHPLDGLAVFPNSDVPCEAIPTYQLSAKVSTKLGDEQTS